MADWDINTQVVCIKAFQAKHPDLEQYPSVGQILTIRTVEPYGADLYLRFYEIVNKEYEYFDAMKEVCFIWTHFRPVRKTDISALKEVAAILPDEAELRREMEETKKELIDA